MKSHNGFLVEYGLSAFLWLGLMILLIAGTPDTAPLLGLTRAILALILTLFLPGYFIQAALFSRANQLSAEERFALSFGLSIVMIPILALVLDGFAIPIALTSVAAIESVLLWGSMLLSLQLRLRRPADERFQWQVHIAIGGWWAGQDRFTRILLIGLCAVGFTALIAVAAIEVSSGARKAFTEFYILSNNGTAAGYPREATVNQPVSVKVVIKNDEASANRYTIEVKSGSQTQTPFEPISLLPHQTFEQELSFTPTEVGQDQVFEFDLFRNDEDTPYRTLSLALNVNG